MNTPEWAAGLTELVCVCVYYVCVCANVCVPVGSFRSPTTLRTRTSPSWWGGPAREEALVRLDR
jgi:hypothetical protein